MPVLRQQAGSAYNIQHLSDLSKLFHLLHKRAAVSCRSIARALRAASSAPAVLLLLLSPPALEAAFGDDPLGSRWHALAGAGVASPALHEPLFQNPAGLVSSLPWQWGITSSRPFGLEELAAWQTGWSRSWRRYGVGVALQRFGGSAYNETMAALGWASAITADVRLGLALRHAQIAIDRYGSAGAWLCDIGGQLRCSSRIRAGFVVRNALASRIGRCREPLPQALQSGFDLVLARATSLCIDLYQARRQTLELRCGIEHLLGERLVLRAGWTTASLRLSAGFALLLKSFSLEYGVMTHPWLGLSHQFGLRYSRCPNSPAPLAEP